MGITDFYSSACLTSNGLKTVSTRPVTIKNRESTWEMYSGLPVQTHINVTYWLKKKAWRRNISQATITCLVTACTITAVHVLQAPCHDVSLCLIKHKLRRRSRKWKKISRNSWFRHTQRWVSRFTLRLLYSRRKSCQYSLVKKISGRKKSLRQLGIEPGCPGPYTYCVIHCRQVSRRRPLCDWRSFTYHRT